MGESLLLDPDSRLLRVLRTDEELKHERAAQYDRLSRAGALDAMIAPTPSAQQIRRARMAGAAGLTLGLGLFVSIVYAVMR